MIDGNCFRNGSLGVKSPPKDVHQQLPGFIGIRVPARFTQVAAA